MKREKENGLVGEPRGSSQSPAPKPPTKTISKGPFNVAPHANLHALLKSIQGTGKQAGLVGSAISGDTLNVYWNGTIPSAASDLAHTAKGTSAEFHSVPYARSDLLAEARRISLLPSVTSAGMGSDFQSIQVTVKTGTPKATVDAMTSKIPLKVTEGRDKVSTVSRHHDTSPFWGGSEVVDDADDTECSTDWGVTVDSSVATGMITAAH